MNSQQYMEIAHGRSILERIRNAREARQAAALNSPAPSASNDAITVLKAIIEEVAGVGQPYSTDSYLPAHLIHDARMAIEQYERDQEASQ
jgi:hypothetical protein